VEKLLSALGHKDRLRIVVHLLSVRAARQVEICRYLADHRGKPVNSGEVSALLKPLLDNGILARERARDPIEIRDRDQLVRLLHAAAALSSDHAATVGAEAGRNTNELRRALLHATSESDTG
jgi:hypothetical protein